MIRQKRASSRSGPLLRAAFLAVLALALVRPSAAAPPAAESTIVTSIGGHTLTLDISGTPVLLPYESNHPIDRPAAIVRLVVTIHGSGRQVILGQAARESIGVYDRKDTLLFLPQFLKDQDRAPHHLPDTMLTWAAAWEWGDLSSNDPRVSSFDVTDRVILDLVKRFPSIRDVVVAGNSAGGQFVQRYAALSGVEDQVNSNGGQVRFTYVVANPSSYLYFDASRVDAAGRVRTPTAAEVARCPDYNSHGYGLEHPNAYTRRADAAAIAARFPRRTVIYFIGDDDNDADHPGLDRHCGAAMQGLERFQRSRNYWTYMTARFGAAVAQHQQRICIPHATHNARTIWDSDCARYYIAGTGVCRPARCPD